MKRLLLIGLLALPLAAQYTPPGGSGSGIATCSTSPPTGGAANSTCYDTAGALWQCSNGASACTLAGQWVKQAYTLPTATNSARGGVTMSTATSSVAVAADDTRNSNARLPSAGTTLVAQKFFGTAAPGSVATNLPGDLYTNTTAHNEYVCNAPAGTAAPACTSVTAAGWLLVNTAYTLPAASAGALGGVNSIASASNNWVSYIDTSGLPHQSQPASTNLSDSAGLERTANKNVEGGYVGLQALGTAPIIVTEEFLKSPTAISSTFYGDIDLYQLYQANGTGTLYVMDGTVAIGQWALKAGASAGNDTYLFTKAGGQGYMFQWNTLGSYETRVQGAVNIPHTYYAVGLKASNGVTNWTAGDSAVWCDIDGSTTGHWLCHLFNTGLAQVDVTPNPVQTPTDAFITIKITGGPGFDTTFYFDNVKVGCIGSGSGCVANPDALTINYGPPAPAWEDKGVGGSPVDLGLDSWRYIQY